MSTLVHVPVMPGQYRTAGTTGGVAPVSPGRPAGRAPRSGATFSRDGSKKLFTPLAGRLYSLGRRVPLSIRRLCTVRTALRGLCALGLALLLAGAAGAQDKKPAGDPAFNFPKQIKLDDKQQAKLDELKKE